MYLGENQLWITDHCPVSTSSLCLILLIFEDKQVQTENEMPDHLMSSLKRLPQMIDQLKNQHDQVQ
jgi:hypothetical protein